MEQVKEPRRQVISGNRQTVVSAILNFAQHMDTVLDMLTAAADRLEAMAASPGIVITSESSDEPVLTTVPALLFMCPISRNGVTSLSIRRQGRYLL
jgi:hypothetical protein